MRLKRALKYIRLNNPKKRKRRNNKSSQPVLWEKANDINKRLINLISLSSLPFDIKNITSLRSYNSKSRAYARIWGLPKVWQLSLNIKPHYVIEVLSEKYDYLPDDKKNEILLHELAHIPGNFSGSLLPHIRYGKRSFRNKVDKLIQSVKINSNK